MKSLTNSLLMVPFITTILAHVNPHHLHSRPKVKEINATIRRHGPPVEKEQDAQSATFVRFLFTKYGSEGTMTFEGLEHLLDNLGLGQVTSFGHALQSHIDEAGNFIEFHDEHQHNGESQDNDDDHHNKHHNNEYHNDKQHNDDNKNSGHHNGHEHDVDERNKEKRYQILHHVQGVLGLENDLGNGSHTNITCLSAKEILSTFNIQYNGGIRTTEFLSLCPALVYQLDQHLCRPRLQTGHSHDGSHENTFHLNPWIGATSAVGIISLAGFFVVSIVPAIAGCAFYHNLVQLLISLAVGTLTSDALLHLLPHAMVPHHHGESSQIHEDGEAHNKHPVWVGLVTFGAILMFFIVERLLKISSDVRARRKNRKKSPNRKSLEDPLSKSDALNKPLELIHLKNESEMGSLKDARIDAMEKMKTLVIEHGHCEHLDVGKEQHDDEFHLDHDDGERLPKDHHHHHHHHHHHGHGHGHSHEVPSSIASVAWMVIMGDGLHNFTDGLAIGTSFSNSLPIGLSTSVAVLCHEIPHELGDFAVLLRSGMSMKQALCCNFLSSILCFAGASLGVIVGNADSITSWVFSITAGIFIYIALVDMLPQITSTYDEEQRVDGVEDEKETKRLCGRNSTLSRLLLHTLGITMGLTLMLLIAIYEDSIKLEIS